MEMVHTATSTEEVEVPVNAGGESSRICMGGCQASEIGCIKIARRQSGPAASQRINLTVETHLCHGVFTPEASSNAAKGDGEISPRRACLTTARPIKQTR